MTGYLVHHLLERGGRDGARTALIEAGREIDYAAFAARVEAKARALRAAGLRRGDRVAVLLDKGWEECAALFAASRADGVMVPVNPALRPRQVHHILSDSGSRILLTERRLLESLEPWLSQLDCLGAVLTLDGEDREIAPGVAELPVDQAAGGAAAPSNAAIGEDLAAILYTSGSTGLPKGVMLSHRNLLAGARIVRSYLGITPEERILSILPLSFDYGLNQLLTAVEQGACLVPFTFRFGDEVVAALRDHAITGLAGVPTLWAVLTRAAPRLAATPLPHLRYITNSGGAVATATIRLLRERLPNTDIYLMYGLTEAFRSTYLPPQELDRRPESIGRAIPECEVLVVDAAGRPVAPGQPGILVHRGPTVSLGYWNRPAETAEVLRPNPLRPGAVGGDIVCFSGDLVRQDEDGFFYFVGRGDAMIKSAGYRISPTEVEEVLMASGMFSQAAVIGLPDPLAGQRVHAVAVAARPDADCEAALAFCAERLAAYMVPRAIELVEALPLSPNGKVDHKALVAARSAHVA